MRKLLGILLICFLILQTKSYSQIVINEVMSWNVSSYRDMFYEYPDWIELYNVSDEVIDLHNWILTDEFEDYKWSFPEISIKPQQYLIVCCSGKDIRGEYELHTNFKISSDGEDIFLFNNKSELIDKVEVGSLMANASYGRLPDGSKAFTVFYSSSPGKTNNNGSLLEVLEFSKPAGFYKQPFFLSLKSVFGNNEIRYTLDGSEPTSNSAIFLDSIYIRSRLEDNNVFSMIRTNPEEAPSPYRWSPPTANVFKGTVIRAATFRNGERVSPVITSTYFIAPEKSDRYSFPVISICSDSLNLFGFEEGIYVPGKVYEDNPSWTNYWGTGNYHQRGDDWERPANIEFFETDGTIAFNQKIGIRIHGSGGRALPEKSLRLYARSDYGDSYINYKIFPKSYKKSFKRIILRNSGQDFLWTLFADALIQDLSRNTGIEFQDARPAIVFINGEYWGIHNIRERYDEYYLQDYTGLSVDELKIFDNGLISHPYYDSDFNEFYEFIKNNDLSIDENYEKVKDYIDIYNTINYYVQKIYFGVYDWPGNNVELWRSKLYGSKWRWFSFDNDDGLMYPEINFFLHATQEDSEDWRNPPWSTFIIRRLMTNKKFSDLLFTTLDLRMSTVFSVENVLNRIDYFEDLYKKEIHEHILRWNYPSSIEFWQYNIERMRDFVRSRPENIEKHKLEYFEKTAVHENLTVLHLDIYPNPNNGYFQVLIPDILREFNIEVTDLLGHIIFSQNFYNYNERFILNLSDQSKGMYSIRLSSGKNIYTSKLIIY